MFCLHQILLCCLFAISSWIWGLNVLQIASHSLSISNLHSIPTFFGNSVVNLGCVRLTLNPGQEVKETRLDKACWPCQTSNMGSFEVRASVWKRSGNNYSKMNRYNSNDHELPIVRENLNYSSPHTVLLLLCFLSRQSLMCCNQHHVAVFSAGHHTHTSPSLNPILPYDYCICLFILHLIHSCELVELPVWLYTLYPTD